MHPDIARAMIRQRTTDMQAQARRDRDARTARAAARGQRDRGAAQAAAAIPRVPDYVDAAFRSGGDRAHARA